MGPPRNKSTYLPTQRQYWLVAGGLSWVTKPQNLIEPLKMVSPKTLKADWGLRMSTDISVQWHMQWNVCFAYFCEILASYDWNNLWEWAIALHGRLFVPPG